MIGPGIRTNLVCGLGDFFLKKHEANNQRRSSLRAAACSARRPERVTPRARPPRRPGWPAPHAFLVSSLVHEVMFYYVTLEAGTGVVTVLSPLHGACARGGQTRIAVTVAFVSAPGRRVLLLHARHTERAGQGHRRNVRFGHGGFET